MSGASLLLDHVCVRRAHRDILSVDRLEVSPGQFLAILGRNGAGKTTLLNLCCGLLKPTHGRVLLNGAELRGVRAPSLRRRIGYLPQAAEYNADLPLTVEEVVRLGRAALRGLLRPFTSEDRDITNRWIEHLGLAAFRRRTFRTLSGGEQQKVLLARAMVQEPELLLLDEPGAHLDIDWRRRLTDTIESIYREAQVTVVMVSHDVALIPACCTRISLMEGGLITASGPPDHVLNSDTLSNLYGCRVDVFEHHGARYAAAQTQADSLKE